MKVFRHCTFLYPSRIKVLLLDFVNRERLAFRFCSFVLVVVFPCRAICSSLPCVTQAGRRERDTRAVTSFEAALGDISERMEQRVLETSYALRDGLEAAEESISSIRKELDIDEQLMQGDISYVEVKRSKASCLSMSTQLHIPLAKEQGSTFDSVRVYIV